VRDEIRDQIRFQVRDQVRNAFRWRWHPSHRIRRGVRSEVHRTRDQILYKVE
jgi:hypothetical protein